MDVDELRALIVPIEGYDDLTRRLLTGELERFRRSLECLDAHPGGSLLDLGSSGSLVPVFMHVLGFSRVACLDMSGQLGPQRLVHEDGAVYEFDSHQVNLETTPYPFPDQSFDQVVSMESLEHLAVDPMFMLAEANRVLKPGGALLLTTPNIVSLSSLYRQLWGRHPAIGGQCYGPGTMDRHHREYAPDELRELMTAAGFEVCRLDTFDTDPLPGAVRKVRSLLKVLRWFKPAIDLDQRGRVIRVSCKKVGDVVERFPKLLYPRYEYYDYAAYDRELCARFGGRRYWRTNVCPDTVPTDAVTAPSKPLRTPRPTSPPVPSRPPALH